MRWARGKGAVYNHPCRWGSGGKTVAPAENLSESTRLSPSSAAMSAGDKIASKACGSEFSEAFAEVSAVAQRACSGML